MKGTSSNSEINNTNYTKNKNSIDVLNQNDNDNDNENETSENYVENYGNYNINDYNASVSEKDFYARINVRKDVETGALYESKLFIDNENPSLKENKYNMTKNNDNSNNIQYNINYSGINNIIVNNKYDNGKTIGYGSGSYSKISLQSNQTEGQASSNHNDLTDGSNYDFHKNGSHNSNSNNYVYNNNDIYNNNNIETDKNNTKGVNPMNSKIKINENGNMLNTRIPTLNFNGNSNGNSKRLISHNGQIKNSIPTTV